MATEETVPVDKVEVRNVNAPHHVTRVDRAKYEAMREALLAALPAGTPGITVADAKEKLMSLLPAALFPEGAKAGWWMKCVQLDLEAQGRVSREPSKPMRIFRTEAD